VKRNLERKSRRPPESILQERKRENLEQEREQTERKFLQREREREKNVQRDPGSESQRRE